MIVLYKSTRKTPMDPIGESGDYLSEAKIAYFDKDKSIRWGLTPIEGAPTTEYHVQVNYQDILATAFYVAAKMGMSLSELENRLKATSVLAASLTAAIRAIIDEIDDKTDASSADDTDSAP